MSHERQLCTFYLEGQYFGVQVERVQEVLRPQPMVRIPLAPPTICGLINLRGQIVIALDLRRRLGMRDRAEGESYRNVVVRSPDGPVSFQVDDIGDVVTVQEEAFERVPEAVQGPLQDVLLGVFKFPKKLLLLLSIDKVLVL